MLMPHGAGLKRRSKLAMEGNFSIWAFQMASATRLAACGKLGILLTISHAAAVHES